MNEVEKSYLESQIVLLTRERASLPARFEQLKAQQEARIEAFLQEAGVLARVKEMRAEVEKLHRNVQSHSDILGGKIEAFQAVLDNFHRLKVPAGTAFDPISGEPLSPSASAPIPIPVAEAPNPKGEATDEGADDEGASEWDEAFAHEATDEYDCEIEEKDEIADAIENATDEEAVRALLKRYGRKA